MAGFPIADWQFWAVTGTAVGAVWMLVKPFLPNGDGKPSSPCAKCGVASGSPCQDPGQPESLVTLGQHRP